MKIEDSLLREENMNSKNIGLIFLLLIFSIAGIAPAEAQNYPTKIIRFVVPLTAGGPTDLIARIVAQPLSASLGQQVIIDNRPGASGNIGAELVAKSPPDGYTLFVAGPGNFAINVSLFTKLPYHPVRDFAPVGLMAFAPYIVAVHPSVPVKTLGDLVKLAKARPGDLNYGAVTGNGAHLATELFKSMTKVNIVHIPYKGAVLANTDLISGQLQLSFASTPGSMPLVKSGKLRALAVTSLKRINSAPDVPTVSESVLKDFEATVWYGLAAPAKTPRAVVVRLNSEIVKIVNSPDIREKLITSYYEPTSGSPEQFQAFIQAEIEKWGKAVQISGAAVN